MRNVISSNLGLINRVKKIMRDQVDHRMEIRREIISDLISFHRFESYLDLCKSVKESLARCKKRLGYFLKNPNAPDFIIKEAGELHQNYKYILTCLASERNFVERYLIS